MPPLPRRRAARARVRARAAIASASRSIGAPTLNRSRSVPSSRTNTQSTFVEINELLVVTRNTQPVTIDVGKTQTSAVVKRIR